MKHRMLLLVIAGVLGAGGGWLFTEQVLKAGSADQAPATPPQGAAMIGLTRPDFSLGGTTGQLISSADFDGQVLLINFWATWCKPCVEELPIFEELNRMYDDQDLKIILVSLDFKSQLERKFVPFLKSKALESDVVLLADQDVDTWIPMFDDMWDGALPATLVLNGKQRIFVTGEFSSVEELKKVVESLKAETPRFRSPVTCGSKLAGQ